MRLHALAKINWTLEVLGRRDDGYHEIRSVLQTIDLADVIELAPADKLRLEVRGSHEVSEDDLTLKGGRLLQGESEYRGGALIRLSKGIPPASGLGGGSADAAAVLRGLNLLWGLRWPKERLASIAAEVSSDASFFLFGGTALAEARGEQITPLPDIPPTRLVLVVPPWSLPNKTARMYARLREGDFSDGRRTRRLLEALGQGRGPEPELLYNAFEKGADETWPDLARYRQAFLKAGAPRVHLAGSGPALFALAKSEEEANTLHAAVSLLPGAAFIAHTVAVAEATRLEG